MSAYELQILETGWFYSQQIREIERKDPNILYSVVADSRLITRGGRNSCPPLCFVAIADFSLIRDDRQTRFPYRFRLSLTNTEHYLPPCKPGLLLYS